MKHHVFRGTSFPNAGFHSSNVSAFLKSGEMQVAQDRVQHVMKLFFKKLTSDPVSTKASDTGLLRVPIFSQIVPLWTRTKHNFYLAFHLQLAGFSVFPIPYPVVPKGTERLRLIFHASNTDAEVKALAQGDRTRLPAAARHVYALIGK